MYVGNSGDFADAEEAVLVDAEEENIAVFPEGEEVGLRMRL